MGMRAHGGDPAVWGGILEGGSLRAVAGWRPVRCHADVRDLVPAGEGSGHHVRSRCGGWGPASCYQARSLTREGLIRLVDVAPSPCYQTTVFASDPGEGWFVVVLLAVRVQAGGRRRGGHVALAGRVFCHDGPSCRHSCSPGVGVVEGLVAHHREREPVGSAAGGWFATGWHAIGNQRAPVRTAAHTMSPRGRSARAAAGPPDGRGTDGQEDYERLARNRGTVLGEQRPPGHPGKPRTPSTISATHMTPLHGRQLLASVRSARKLALGQVPGSAMPLRFTWRGRVSDGVSGRRGWRTCNGWKERARNWDGPMVVEVMR